jgi:hypothetical protein
LSEMNWAALPLARKKIPYKLIPFLVNLMIQRLPVGKRTAKYGNGMTMCYCCGEEDFQHLFCCTQKATQQKEQNIELQKIDTALEVQKALIFWINAWMPGETDNELIWSKPIEYAIQQRERLDGPK